MVNRYSFSSDAADSVGGADGQLLGEAIISNNAVVLNGSSAYVNLPNNLCTGLTSLTFEAWVTDTGGSGWARLLDFGNSNGGEDAQGGGTSYIFLAWPGSGGNTIRACFREPGQAEVYIQYSPKPAIGVAHHVVWTQDGNRQCLDGLLGIPARLLDRLRVDFTL